MLNHCHQSTEFQLIDVSKFSTPTVKRGKVPHVDPPQRRSPGQRREHRYHGRRREREGPSNGSFPPLGASLSPSRQALLPLLHLPPGQPTVQCSGTTRHCTKWFVLEDLVGPVSHPCEATL